jgi:hypothetical protein
VTGRTGRISSRPRPADLLNRGAAFTAMLQLSLVCERWPLGGIGLRWPFAHQTMQENP